MSSMRSKIASLTLFQSLFCFGAAGFADTFSNLRNWLYPAYLTCFITGICILAILTFLSWKHRSWTDKTMSKTSDYLRTHRLLGVLVAGLLIAIPLSFVLSVLWQLIWFMAILPYFVVFISFPVLLAMGQFRNKYLLNGKVLKWMCFIAISAVLASLAFVALIEFKVLPFSEDTTFVRGDEGLYLPTHPWDSLKEIWSMFVYMVIDVVFSILLVLIGRGLRYIYPRLGFVRNE